MMYFHRLGRLPHCLFSVLLVGNTLAFQLQPIDLLNNEGKDCVPRNNDYSKLNLLSSESFLWGGKLNYPVLHLSEETNTSNARSQ